MSSESLVAWDYSGWLKKELPDQRVQLLFLQNIFGTVYLRGRSQHLASGVATNLGVHKELRVLEHTF